jgi:4-diphosphocytidyl-2-C-methyl-D-erythritol kinase
LGSDCPFFIQNKPAFVSGRGELLQPINLDLSNKFLVLVNPGIHVPTPVAYSHVKPKAATFNLRNIIDLPLDQWTEHIVNDFEKGIFEMHPGIEIIKQKLYEHGALYASMSGSGSSVYGLFEQTVECKSIFPDYFVFSSLL